MKAFGQVALVLALLGGVAARAEVLYWDNFDHFANGVSLNSASYLPPLGPAGANAQTAVKSGPASITVTNLAGSLRALADCWAASECAYEGTFPAPRVKPLLILSWSLWIQTTNAGDGGLSLDLPAANNDFADAQLERNPFLCLCDRGQVVMYTNSPSASLPLVCGSWEQWAGTVMSCRLVLNSCGGGVTFTINGYSMVSAKLPPYFANVFDAVRFTFSEATPGGAGNRFALDDVKVELIPLPRLTAIQKVGKNIQVSFTTEPGKHYYVYRVDNLVTGYWDFVDGTVTGTGGVVSVTDEGAIPSPKRFYRVGLST
jgi:hypothetical protein